MNNYEIWHNIVATIGLTIAHIIIGYTIYILWKSREEGKWHFLGTQLDSERNEKS